MKFYLLIVPLLLSASTAFAYNPTSPEPERPYDIIQIDGDMSTTHEYLGDLDGYPEMYEFTVEAETEVKIKVLQREVETSEAFGLILIRQNDNNGGVTEMARLNQPAKEWKSVYSRGLAVAFVESRTIELSLSPGIYRTEVSTPENKGNYLLVIGGGESVSAGYFSMLGNVRETQAQFGYSIFHVFFSPYYYIPLILLVIIFGLYTLRRRRSTI